MAPRTRLRQARQCDDAGSTVIELLVVMIIMSGLLSIIYMVLITVQRQTADTVRRADAVDQARLGLSQIDRQVRSGNVLYDPAADPMSMRVYTQSNGVKRCVQWRVDAPSGELRTRSWQPLTSVVIVDWHPVARHLVNDSAASPPFVLAGGGAGSYGKRLVDVVLRVKDPKADGQPVEVRASLSGRNTRYGFDPSVCTPPTP